MKGRTPRKYMSECRICGNIFDAVFHDSRYCSEDCRLDSQLEEHIIFEKIKRKKLKY